MHGAVFELEFVVAAKRNRSSASSPIEEMFLAALNEALNAADDEERGASEVEFARQVTIGRAKVDFLLENGRTRLAVECDGHDFHERTKDQASRDKARDRALQAAGVYVFRFTGSDIHWDAYACAQECIDFLLKREDERFSAEVLAWHQGHDAGWMRGIREAINSENPRYVDGRWVAGDKPLRRATEEDL
jgi:very-short-patch-repair endonuclease